jgi:hypothetical protein
MWFLVIDTPKLPPEQGKAKLSLTRGFAQVAGARNVFFRIKDSLRNMQLRKGTRVELAENKKMISQNRFIPKIFCYIYQPDYPKITLI